MFINQLIVNSKFTFVDYTYKYQVKINDELLKSKLLTKGFINNQLYNFLIEKLYDNNFQTLLSLYLLGGNKHFKHGSFFQIESTLKVRNFLLPYIKEYFHKRNISIKGMSKSMQLVTESFLRDFNKIYRNKKKTHQYKNSKISSSFTYDGKIEVKRERRKVEKIVNGKKKKCRKTISSIKIGSLIVPYRNHRTIKDFTPSQVKVKWDIDRFFISLIGVKKVSIEIKNYTEDELKKNSIGTDINCDNVTLTDGTRLSTEIEIKDKHYEVEKKCSEIITKYKDKIELNWIANNKCWDNSSHSSLMHKELCELLNSDKYYQRYNLRLQKSHRHVNNKKKDKYCKQANGLSLKNHFIFIPDDNYSSMRNGVVSNSTLHKSSMGLWRSICESKYSTIARVSLRVNPYNRSKKCNKCKFIYEKLDVFTKQWDCQNCLTTLDRDDNASANHLEDGIEAFFKSDIKTVYKKNGKKRSLPFNIINNKLYTTMGVAV